MPTYEIQAPDGQTYEIEGPAGASDAQVREQVLRQFPQAGTAPAAAPVAAPAAAPPAGPSAGTRLYQSVAKPFTDYLGQGMEAATAPLVGVARMAQGETPRAAFGPETWQSVGQGGKAAETRQQAAGVVVPQTPLQAGIMAGTLAAGPVSRAVPALAPLTKYPAIARILGGTLGGAAGGAVEDPTLAGAGRGAAWGAGTTAGGEVLGKVLGKVARSAPGAKGTIAAEDASDYLREVGRQSPPLKGFKTVQDVQRLAGGQGKDLLGQAKEAAVQKIEGMMPPMSALNIPSLGQTVRQNVPVAGTAGIHTTTTPRPFSLREANDALSEIGAKAFSKNPLDRTFNGVDQRQLYGQVEREILSELQRRSPQAAALFSQIQDQYKSGLTLLKPAESARAFRIGPSGTQFNTPYFQGYAQDPKKIAAMGNKLGDADFQAFRNVLTRGAGEGKDVLASGEGHMLDALRQTIGRGTISGAMGYLGVPFRTALPNVGSQYVGRQPMQLLPALQQALDLVLQRQAGSVSAAARP